MFTTRTVLRKLNTIIDTLRSNINNKEVLDYILPNLELATRKGAIVKLGNDNTIMIVDYRDDKAFYLEINPSLDVIDKIYTRITRAGGDYDERATIVFDKDAVRIHKYASVITKDKDEDRIIDLTDTFEDKTLVNEELRFRKSFSTNVSYPLNRNAVASSDLEEVVINPDGTAAFKRIGLSSSEGDSSYYGLFSAKDNNFASNSKTTELSEVQTVTEDEYNDFISKADPKYIKELK